MNAVEYDRYGPVSVLAAGRFPKRVGFDRAGEIAEVGSGLTGVPIGAA